MSNGSTRPLLGYALVLAAAAYFLWAGRHLAFGRVAQIGPGFFPTMLALLMGAMAILGLVLELARRRAGSSRDEGGGQAVDWKSLATISISILVFAASVRVVGLLPAVVLTFVLASVADSRARLRIVLPLSIGLALLTWAIFIAGLAVSIPAFRIPW